MKKTLLVFIFCLLVISQVSWAAEPPAVQPLEIIYPTLPEAVTPTTTQTPITWYAKYIFHFIIAIGGIVALGVLIWAGFNWLTSTGLPEKKKEAQGRITSAFVGLVILLGSWLILFTINPNLTSFNLGGLKPILRDLTPGIYLCNNRLSFVRTVWDYKKREPSMSIEEAEAKRTEIDVYMKQINEFCYLVPSSGKIKQDFEDKSVQAWIVPPINQKQRYGAILYEENNFGGKNQVIYNLEYDPASYNISELRASSIKLFVLKEEIPLGSHVEVFQLPDQRTHNEAGQEKNHQKYYPRRQGDWASLNPPFSHFTSLIYHDHQFQSVKIDGELIVIFFRELTCSALLEGGWTPVTEVYALIQTDNDMNDNYPIGRWGDSGTCNAGFVGLDKYPCAECMVVIVGGTY